MLQISFVRWAVAIASLATIGWAIVSWCMSATPDDEITIAADVLAKVGQTPTNECGPLLTDIQADLRPAHDVRQVVLLQAVANEPPLVIAAALDTSHEEGATHWPSPWQAVNDALSAGRLDGSTSVAGRHGRFDYRHYLLPVDESGTRLVLVNLCAKSPTWNLQRISLVVAGTMMLAVLVISRM